MNTYGETKGDTCNRNGCKGIIEEHEVENCSCHISPPCSSCTTPKEYCPTCGWESKNDIIINDYRVTIDPINNIKLFKIFT